MAVKDKEKVKIGAGVILLILGALMLAKKPVVAVPPEVPPEAITKRDPVTTVTMPEIQPLAPPEQFIAIVKATYGEAKFQEFVNLGEEFADFYTSNYPQIFGTTMTPERAAASAITAYGTVENPVTARQALAAEIYFYEHDGVVPPGVLYYDVVAMKEVYKPPPPEPPPAPVPAPPPEEAELYYPDEWGWF